MDTHIWHQFSLLLLGLGIASAKLRIIDLKVPSTIENGSHDVVILDCDFEATKDEAGLEVKWFYGEDEQIYQWIPNRSKPQALGSLKDRIDLSYKASNDPNTMYRALRIKDVTPELSGDYKCKITSFVNEDSATKKMIIYEPAKEFEFIHMDEDNKVICTANGVYPEPELIITIISSNGTKTIDNNNQVDYDDDDGDDVDDNNDNYGNKDLANVEVHDEPAQDANSDDDNTDDDDDTDGTNNDTNNDDDDDDDNEDDDENEFIKTQNDDKTFNLTRVLSYNEAEMSGDTKIVCELFIPDTTYREKKSVHIYTGNISTTTETQKQSEFDNDTVFATNATETIEEDNGSWQQVPSITLLLATFLLFIMDAN